MRLTKSDILALPHLEAIGFDEVKNFRVTGVSIDTRTIKANELFIAIRGNQFDGHNFISKAIESNAAGIIVERRWAETNAEMMVSIHVPRIIVENTIHALGYLAQLFRRQYNIPFIAVGGSNGKTTTKEMIRSVLNGKYHVLCTEGNLNNHIGVPQTLFRLQKKHQIAVVEMGTNHPGEIEYLCSILKPTHGLITNIGREHLEFFGSIQSVAKAECELFDWLIQHKGVVFVNADDNHLTRLSRKAKKMVRYGFGARSISIKGKIKSFNTNGQALLCIKPRSKKEFDITVGTPGKHNAQNALAAATIGLTMRVSPAKIQKALASFMPASMRMQIQKMGDVTILNDTYNANPDSTLAALETLQTIKSTGKRIVVLADMLELGDQAKELHRQIGQVLTKYKVDVLLTFGALSKYIYDSTPIENKAHFESKLLLVEHLFNILASNDIVLIKGSRGMKMDEVTSALHERFSQKAGI
jgi:UDP-N-acetylmuramoyl-tripeptide--D-alanyl-D-alanine ligase